MSVVAEGGTTVRGTQWRIAVLSDFVNGQSFRLLRRQVGSRTPRLSWRRVERAVWFHEAIRHVRSVECGGGPTVAVEQDEPASGARAMREFADARVGNKLGTIVVGLRSFGSLLKTIRGLGRFRQEIDRHFGHHDLHDSFAVSRAGNAAEFRVGIAAAADEWGVSEAARVLAAGPTGRRSGENTTPGIDGDGSDSALSVACMVLGGVRVRAAKPPSIALLGRNQVLGIAEKHAVFLRELLRSLADEQNVFTFFENAACQTNGIADTLDRADRTGFERGTVHQDRVQLNSSVQRQVGAIPRVECGIFLKDDDCGFDRVTRAPSGG